MSHQALKDKLHQLSASSEHLSTAGEKVKALSSAVEVANGIIKILNPNASGLNHGEDALEEIISTNSFRNTKVAEWFSYHPIYPDERLALKFYESDICEIKFYWLNDNSTKARISAGVMLTPNWEDNETTENDDYKVGIDFFLKKDAKSLLMVVSERGNLRVMEFSDYLTHTQEEILDKIAGSLALPSRKAFHNVLWESMALSEVNRKFYEGIAHHFTILCQHLISSGKDKEDAKLFASRLLGRLLFIWFLRKKGALSNEDYYFPSDIKDSTKYYNSILKPLFFQVLNTPVYARKNGDTKTPYLNGGLFDAHENDWPYENTKFPTSFFLDLYDHLNKYNFTTDESSPDYEQVAIDPEMLGRVFESLLAEQRTDTGEQVRKAKGTFYTPREIVSYMCKESLRQYLYTELGDEKYYSGVDKLLDSPDYEWETAHSNAKRDLWPFENMKKFIPHVIGILDSLTILDPACGSGAFPMGMLQLLTKVYERLDARFDPYQTKMNIIENTIFGVDIEPMAVEISRLRAWLAIIVDDEGNIDPLPNLDFKFICADSLIPLETSTGLWDDKDLHAKMAEVRAKYFNARKPESKDKWRKEYYKLTSTKNMWSGRREIQLASFDPFKNRHPAKFFDPDFMFGVNKFDIIIGNPPYVDYRKISNDQIKNTFKVAKYSKMINLYVYFFEHGFNLLKDGGVLCYISPQQYLILDNCKGLRDIVREYGFILLADFSMAGVFDAGTYPFVSLVKKTKSTTKFLFREYRSMKDLTHFKREMQIQNPIPEPVNISEFRVIIDKINAGNSIFELVDDIFVASSTTQERLPLEEGKYKFIEASNISEYSLNNIKNTISPSDAKYSSASMKKQFNEIVVTSRMTSSIRAAIVDNENEEFLGGKVNIIVPKASNSKIIAAFLNSKIINFWFRENFGMTHMQGGALPINASDLKKIPIIALDKSTKQSLVTIVSSIIEQRKHNIKSDTSSLQNQIDEILFNAYHLTDEEKENVRNF